MTQARKSQISISDTPYYHCMGRCVRRAFLFGEDGQTGKDYSHRKIWITDKLRELAKIYTIDAELWIATVKEYSKSYHAFVGSERELKEICETTGKKWLAGIKRSRMLFLEKGGREVGSL